MKTDQMKCLFEIWNEAAAVGIGLYLFFSLRRLNHFLKKEPSSPSRIGFYIVGAVTLFFLIVDWSGLISIDDLFLLRDLHSGRLSAWHSISYSTFIEGLYYLFGSPFWASVINFVLFMNLTALIFSMNRWTVRDWRYWLLIFLFITPQTHLLVMVQNRDSTYSLLLLIFLFGLLKRKMNFAPDFEINVWELVFFGLILGEMRQEGLYLLGLAPFLFYYYLQPTRKQFTKILFRFAVGCLMLFILVPRLFSITLISSVYKSTVWINPLNFIIHERGMDSLTEEERKKINSYYKIENLVDNYSPYSIKFFNNGIRQDADDKYPSFQSAAMEVIWNNFDLYLKNRSLMFQRMFNFDRESYFIYEDARRATDLDFVGNTLNEIGESSKSPQITGLQQCLRDFRLYFCQHLPMPWHLLLSSGLIPLVGLFFIFIGGFAQKSPHFSILSGVLLMRTFIFAIFTPVAQFRYVASIWLGGWLLLILFSTLNMRDGKIQLATHQ